MEVVDQYTRSQDDLPVWYEEKRDRINEVVFCRDLIAKHPMECIQGQLYDLDGMVDTGKLENEIFTAIAPYVSCNVANKVKKLMDALRINAHADTMPIDTEHIHFSNGTYTLADRSFTTEKTFCLNRLPVRFDPDAPVPVRWHAFLNELLYVEDIPALQEFMGYTFIPTNKAQAMMLLIGNGGEGKSRIALILRELLGDNMNNSHIAKLATDRFEIGSQVGKLLLVDDDIKTDALPDTSVLKTIVTLEDGKYAIEKKNVQTYQGTIYVRLLALGNGALSALYDKSDGFYRRQLVIQVKPKPEDREDDRNLIDKLRDEREGILLWCLEGLHRLIGNEYKFSISARMRENLEEMKKNDNNIIDFLESDCIKFEKGACAWSKELLRAYKGWCDENAEVPLRDKTFFSHMMKNRERLGIKDGKNVTKGGSRARGFYGVRVVY